jgi:signal transduction histidine kinase
MSQSLPAWPVITLAILSWLPSNAAGHVVTVIPERLPVRLVEGWEAADGDAAAGVSSLRELSWRPVDPLSEPAPAGGFRWYRLRLDASACRGVALAFHTRGLRDADEAYLDGRKIGGTGSFPPNFDPASLQVRLYPLPTDVTNAPGIHELAIRVYQAPPLQLGAWRESPREMWQAPAEIDRLSVTHHQSWFEQTLAFLAGIGLSLAAAFIFFYFGDPVRDRGSVAFAALSLLVVLYLLTGHSAWSLQPIPHDIPFRIAVCAAVLLCLSYFAAMWRTLELRPPRRFCVYVGVLLGYILAVALATDLRWLATPSRIAQAVALLGLAELVPATWRRAKTGRHGAWKGRAFTGHATTGFCIIFLWPSIGAPLNALDVMGSPRPRFYPLFAVGLAALGLALYRLGARQVDARVNAVVSERDRLAREIHDSLAQGLAALSIQLEGAAETLVSGPDLARDHLDRARRLVRASLADARRAVWDLRPEILQRVDLASALEDVIDMLTVRSRIDARVEVEGAARGLAGSVERQLLCIGREAVTNAVKHADPRRIRLRLAFRDAAIELDVEDDGCGFDPFEVSAGAGFGLLSMRERAHELGADLLLESAPGRGTRVRVELPG